LDSRLQGSTPGPHLGHALVARATHGVRPAIHPVAAEYSAHDFAFRRGFDTAAETIS
jgi:hypothetical protein